MRSPRFMRNIEIDITNECVNRCSNCTRFCGHHKTPYFMDFETFKNAVDSLDDWEGTVGIMGGEPTIHPEFERFADYLREKRVGKKLNLSNFPISDMQKHIYARLSDFSSKVVLLSSINRHYYKHFEVINDTFPKQLLNDHQNKCMHQALLMSRKELGIPDEEWIQKRDACWIQNTWSASITPKGAFFCEVAGALDMLFNGPGGWKVEKGWYNREVEDFGEQLKWCEYCSACIDVPQRLSSDGYDDVTPLMFEKLKEVGSPKAEKGLCIIHNPKDFNSTLYKTFTSGNQYMEAGGNIRTTKENRNLYPKHFDIINYKEFSKTFYEKMPKDWVIVCKNENTAQKLSKKLSNLILNPGCLYIYKDMFVFNILAKSIRLKIQTHETLKAKKLKSIWDSSKIININYLKSPNRFLSFSKNEKHNILCFLGIKIKFKRKSKTTTNHILEYYTKKDFFNALKNDSFEFDYSSLIKGLDNTSKEIIDNIIRRIKLANKNSKFILIEDYNAKEKEEYEKIQMEFFKKILKNNDNNYQYKNYVLRKKHYFEPTVLYAKYFLDKINNIDNLKNKDIIDVGAYVGDSAILFSKYTDKNVYAFEPLQGNFNEITRTIELNKSKNIIPVQFGLGSKEQKMIFYVDGARSGDKTKYTNLRKETVNIISLDTYVRKNNLDVGLIKVDIEGAEQNFLQGAKETICSQKPVLLLSIYHNYDDFFKIKTLLESWNLGYKFQIAKLSNNRIYSDTVLIAQID